MYVCLSCLHSHILLIFTPVMPLFQGNYGDMSFVCLMVFSVRFASNFFIFLYHANQGNYQTPNKIHKHCWLGYNMLLRSSLFFYTMQTRAIIRPPIRYTSTVGWAIIFYSALINQVLDSFECLPVFQLLSSDWHFD